MVQMVYLDYHWTAPVEWPLLGYIIIIIIIIIIITATIFTVSNCILGRYSQS